MILETQRLILRNWQENDAEDLFKLAKDPLIGPYCGWLPHTSVENSLKVIRDELSSKEAYAVVLKSESKIVGSVAFEIGKESNLGIPQNEAEIGFWIGVPYWGQGFMPEAVKIMLKHGFYDLKLETIWCGYFDGNEKSKRVQEKCGFSYNRTIKSYWPLLKEIKIEHVNCMTKSQFEKIYNN